MGLYGVTARAEEPTRTGQAFEQEWVKSPYGYSYIGRQYTSQYDLMRGQIFPEITVQYSVPNIAGMFNPWSMFMPTESGSSGSAIGGLFTGPSMQLPVSPMSYYLGTMGAPRYDTYQSQGLLTGSTNYMSLFQGLGFGGAGFMLGPFRGLGFGGYSGYPGIGYGGGFGYNPYGYSGASSGSSGGFPTRIY